MATVLASVGSVAYVAKDAQNDALAIQKATVSLAQAINLAELHVRGRAIRAEYERTKLGAVYEVEVVSGAKVFEVRVDVDKGNVVTSVEDTEDHDDDHGCQD